ncbi:pantetheine-phosphate adenylyltransferase [Salinibacter ruber]|uniref:Phosphopantetheine adenylyltransferase n=1 Tax=Salinibacter ruber TaxID=146919 RepID=A0A9X2RDQ0_9BACT|nr:pantetheine-phosphate adenylyltransferase [Salinibacter ruber]MCS3856730.1 pantetheine-phosphate adenylyltransferase [Salinibacter ruber]MCS3863556.1 pantetheine-phosphate adenylyltransferase [Salinibacter ruber]MCS4150284.1 pantetheine-phosphate adenylyltransferase [Salinibacter ruber]
MNPNFALYPGTFDPFTFGHRDVLERALRVFDRVEVTVGVNLEKETLFSTQERTTLVRRCTEDLEGVEVQAHQGLIVDRAQKVGAVALVRGLRQVSDFDAEFRMAFANRKLAPELETVFFMTSEEYALISSSMVRDAHRWDGDVSKFVPPPVVEALEQKGVPARS